jgi:hypothetical protein
LKFNSIIKFKNRYYLYNLNFIKSFKFVYLKITLLINLKDIANRKGSIELIKPSMNYNRRYTLASLNYSNKDTLCQNSISIDKSIREENSVSNSSNEIKEKDDFPWLGSFCLSKSQTQMNTRRGNHKVTNNFNLSY